MVFKSNFGQFHQFTELSCVRSPIYRLITIKEQNTSLKLVKSSHPAIPRSEG